MSASAFEAHCGAALAKKWRASLRSVEDGSTMEQWLAARGIIPPGTRAPGGGETRSPQQEGPHPQRPYPFAAAWKMHAARKQLGADAAAGGGAGDSGRPGMPRRPVWLAGDLVRLVAALSASEGARLHAQSLTDLLTRAAGQGERMRHGSAFPWGRIGRRAHRSASLQLCLNFQAGVTCLQKLPEA